MDERRPPRVLLVDDEVDFLASTSRDFLRFALAPDAQVRDIDLGGRIEVDNHPGVGCTFRLILPQTRL